MSVSQHQVKPAAVKVSANILHCFKSFHFILLGGVLLLTFSTMIWLQKQSSDREAVSSGMQQQAIVEFTQDALTLQTLSQDLSTLVFDIKKALQSLDRQQEDFLNSNQFFLVNSIYQEAAYTQSLVIKTFETMAYLDEALSVARNHARQYQSLSPAYSSHLDHVQSMQNQADILGRAFYKLSWKFDEVTREITQTLQYTRYNGFAAGANHFSSVGAQKTAAMESSIFGAGSKLTTVKSSVGETIGLVEQALSQAVGPNLTADTFSKTNQWSIATLLAGFIAVALIWFYGVTKPKVNLTTSAEALIPRNDSNGLGILASPKGEWGAIALALEQVALNQQAMDAQYSQKVQELEQLKLSVLANPYIAPNDQLKEAPMIENALMAEALSQQEPLPGFEQQPYRLN